MGLKVLITIFGFYALVLIGLSLGHTIVWRYQLRRDVKAGKL